MIDALKAGFGVEHCFNHHRARIAYLVVPLYTTTSACGTKTAPKHTHYEAQYLQPIYRVCDLNLARTQGRTIRI
jgi:hypothetical protein